MTMNPMMQMQMMALPLSSFFWSEDEPLVGVQRHVLEVGRFRGIRPRRARYTK